MKADGGIFTPNTRKKLLGMIRTYGRDQTKHDFWYKKRERVKRALIDLELFINVAGKNNLNQTLTRETLEPVVRTLLWETGITQPDRATDQNRAEIAQLFIEWGFKYYQEILGYNIPLVIQNSIKEAVDLSNFLTDFFKPLEERKYSAPGRLIPYGY